MSTQKMALRLWTLTALLFSFVLGPMVGPVTGVSADASEAPVAAAGLAGRLSLGDAFTCAVVEGRVFCWGDNQSGQTAQLLLNQNKTPVEVPGITTATQVSAGSTHACALLANGTVSCWGFNSTFQLGRPNGVDDFSKVPAVVSGVSGAIGVAAGNGHTCALLTGGSAKCWGDNSSSQLGDGTTGPATDTPQAVPGLTNGARIVASGTRTCVLTTSGGVTCWGNVQKYVMGAGDDPDDITSGLTSNVSYSPVQVVKNDGLVALSGMVSVSVSRTSACALAPDNTAWCWGSDMRSQIGSGAGSLLRGAVQFKAPNQSQPLSDIQQISAGEEYTCMVRTGGVPWCIGDNMGGQLGDGTNTYSPTPRLKTVIDVAKTAVVVTSMNHTCSIDSDSMVYCWGTGSAGQIGHGTLENALTPVVVTGAATQTITFGALADKSSSDPAFAVSATASSGAAVSFASTTPSVCTVSGSTVTLVSVGTCTISASRGAYGLYKAADAVSRSFSVSGLKPSATTGTASAETTTATLGGEVNANGADTTVRFEYGLSATLATSESVAVAAAVTGATAKAVSASVSKLSPGKTYYWRVAATNAIGVATGDIKSFTTKGSKPTVSTVSATRGTSGMTLNGKVNANDLDTSVRFEYGTDANLVGATQTVAKTQTGATEEDVSAAVSGLAENTTYYYRIVASNELGTATGETKSFTTVGPEGVSINDGDEFTSSAKVVISVVGPPNAARILVSNDGGFKTSTTFDLVNGSADVPWSLVVSRDGTFTKTVYVRFLSRFNSKVTDDKQDDIILDTTKPRLDSVSATPSAATPSAVTVSAIHAKAKAPAAAGVKLSVRAIDTISGAVAVEVRSAANKPAIRVPLGKAPSKVKTVGLPRQTIATVTLRSSAKALQIRAVDGAGNMSAWVRVTVKK